MEYNSIICEKSAREDKRRERIGKWVQRKLSENGPMKLRDLVQAMNSKNGDRNHLQYVLGALKDVGVVEEKDDGTWVLLQHSQISTGKANTVEYNSIGANRLAAWYADGRREIRRAGNDEREVRDFQGEALIRVLLLIADKIHGTAKD